MAFETGGSRIVDRMAIGAGCAPMIGAISIATAGMGCVPVSGGMTLGTVGTHPGVCGRQGMTGNTVSRKPGKNSASMTLRTVQVDVCTSQRESRQVMVEGGRQPAVSGVAGGAIFAELAVVFIILLVAGITVAGCALEDMINMTLLAGHSDMFTRQFESGQVMIEGGRCPAIGSVAGTAVRAQTALVGVVFLMAGRAVFWGRLEVRKGAGIYVTLSALDLGMFPGQLEWYASMVEFVGIGIQPIVAGQAVITKVQGMGLHESRLEPDMAGGADGLVKWWNVGLRVAIFAVERGAVGFDLVGGQ